MGAFLTLWLTSRFPPWGIWSKNFKICQIPTPCPHSPPTGFTLIGALGSDQSPGARFHWELCNLDVGIWEIFPCGIQNPECWNPDFSRLFTVPYYETKMAACTGRCSILMILWKKKGHCEQSRTSAPDWESIILLTIGIWNPKQGVWNPESKILNPQHRVQNSRLSWITLCTALSGDKTTELIAFRVVFFTKCSRLDNW